MIIQDDVPCTRSTASIRRVCRHHYSALHQAGKLEELTGHFKPADCVLERRPDDAQVEGFCCLVVNGVPCTNTPRGGGCAPIASD